MLKNIFYSSLWNKCPQCHQGDVFITNNAYKLSQFDKMHEHCSCCDLKYEKEPGFYQGAMYVSYGLMVGWFVITWAADTFLVHSQTWQYLTFLSASILVMMPLTFRISRLLWINMFTKFDKSKSICAPKAIH